MSAAMGEGVPAGAAAGTFWDVLELHAAAAGDREAVVRGSGSLTFAGWRAGAERVSAWFCTVGRPGDRVLVWMDDSPALAMAILGLWRAGAVVTLLDVRSKGTHVAHVVATVQPVAILCDAVGTLPAAAAVPAVPFADIDERQGAIPPARSVLPPDPAYIIHTSGSTGRPKGVTQSHRNLLDACRAATASLRLRPDERLLCTTPLSFSFGFGHMLSMLLTGGTLVLPEVLNTFGICDAIARQRPTYLAGIPSLFIQLLRSVSPIRDIDLSPIRAVMSSGGRLPGHVIEDLRALLPGRDIFLNYGLTESYRSACLDPSQVAVRPTSSGRPLPGGDIVIVREDGTLAAPHETGEIVQRGGYVCLGYWNDPEATARAIRPDPLAPAGCPTPPTALFTGDYGCLDEEGYLYVHGRRDHQVKSMGVRVSTLEIEELLHGSGLLSEVAVVTRPHELLEHEIWAVCVPQSGTNGDLVPALRAWARTSMSPFMAPRRYLVRSGLPRTTTGKIDYAALSGEVRLAS